MKRTEYVENIIHQGVVESVDARRGLVTVLTDSKSECDCCPAAKLCKSGSEEGDRITVESKIAGAFRPGDRVRLVGTEQMHRRAIFLATVIPSILLVVVMVGIYMLTLNQLAACLSGIGVTILFFVMLYLMRNRISHEFLFNIVKEPNDNCES